MQKTKPSTRVLSLLLAALTILGILPSSIMMASAGDPIPPPSTSQLATIKLESANDDGTLKNPPSMPAEIRLDKYYQVSGEGGSYGKYHITTLNRNVSHFTCDFDLGSNNIAKGFCTQYGLHIGTDLENEMWKNPEKVTTANYSEDIIRFLDYYAYLQTLHKEVHKHYFPELGECTPDLDKKIANGEVDSPYKDKFTVFKGWTQANIDEVANQAQAFIWAAQEIGPAYKPFSDSYYRAQACLDRVSLCQSFNVSITTTKANEWFDQIYSAIMSSTDIPHFDHYIYHYGSGVQNMLVSLIPEPGTTKEGFFVKVQKMMDGRPLQGAKFKVYKDRACNVPFDGGEMISDANGITISNKLMVPKDNDGSTSFQVHVKETEAPEGIGLSDEMITITVDPTVSNTRDNPATNSTTVINDTQNIPDKAFLRKVDAVTGEGVGGAKFRFKNDSFNKVFDTDPEGVLELQWWDAGKTENYIPPGHYSVTEEKAPDGYLKTDEVIAVDLWIEDGKPYSSGPIVFKNYKKFRIELLKVDENNQPLAGAEFKIWKDGEEFASKTNLILTKSAWQKILCK